jgi:hypothetical protein
MLRGMRVRSQAWQAVAGVVFAASCAALIGTASSAGGAPTTVALHTVPGAHLPVIQVLSRAAGVKSGYIFVAEKQGGKTGGPMIVDSHGRVVWYHQIAPPVQATDFRVQRYRGKPVLTWWQGIESVAGVGKGLYEIYDLSYRHVATIRAGNGLSGDLHEFELTPRGTAFITAYREVPADLSGIGGPKQGYASDSVVQEIDVATGHVVFEWHSIDHVPLSESTQANREPARNATKKRPLDYFHVNSAADGPGGTILISGRNVSTIYLLARDGNIVWRLGGKQSDFAPKAAVRFAFQHNARLHGNLLSLFDNGGIPRIEPFSRPLVLRLDIPGRRAAIVRNFQPPKKIASPYEGNLELLPGGGALVGWGGIRQVSEFAADGRLVLHLRLPYGDTYRAYLGGWSGRPASRPAVAVDGQTLYASWNGATRIARWQLLTGTEAAHLKPAATVPWSGLEAAIALGRTAGAVAVRALDAHGAILGTSQVVRP